MKRPEIKALVTKVVVFSIIGLIFWLLTPNAGLITYAILVGGAIIWFLYETNQKNKISLIRHAIIMGLFLMIFDFIAENIGAFAGLWTSPQSIFSVIAVPIEIIALCFIGGYAWAMHLPLKPDKVYMVFEILIFGFFGALGEYLLILNGMMIYTGGWTSIHAFIAYAAVWLLLFGVWYKVIRKV